MWLRGSCLSVWQVPWCCVRSASMLAQVDDAPYSSALNLLEEAWCYCSAAIADWLLRRRVTVDALCHYQDAALASCCATGASTTNEWRRWRTMRCRMIALMSVKKFTQVDNIYRALGRAAVANLHTLGQHTQQVPAARRQVAPVVLPRSWCRPPPSHKQRVLHLVIHKVLGRNPAVVQHPKHFRRLIPVSHTRADKPLGKKRTGQHHAPWHRRVGTAAHENRWRQSLCRPHIHRQAFADCASVIPACHL